MDAEAARRRQETLEFQARRKREEYARTWKRYGDAEVNIRSWKQRPKGVWVVDAKFTSDRTCPTSRFDSSLDALVRDGVLSPAERARVRHAGELNPLHLPSIEERGVVDFGDTLIKLAQRYGLTLQELLSLNPGLEGARLIAGTQINLVRCAAENSGLIERWKRATNRGNGWPNELDNRPSEPSPLIAVDCRSLTINTKPAGESWGSWKRPQAADSLEQLLVDRCAQR